MMRTRFKAIASANFLVRKLSRFSIHRIARIFLLLLLAFGMAGSLPLKVNTSTSGSNFYEEVTGLPFHPRTLDVDSQGHIFILSYDQDVWRSTDQGISWTKVLDDLQDWSGASSYITRNWLTLFVDSNDYVFVNISNGTKWNLLRSVDRGDSWSIVIDRTSRSWHMDEASNGTLWFYTYTGPGWALIYKSVDYGATWRVFSNLTMIEEDLRVVAVNDYNDNEVWAATSERVMYWNGSLWITIYASPSGTSRSYISSIWFDAKSVYLGAEYLSPKRANWRYPHAPIPDRNVDFDYYWDPDRLPYVPDEHSFDGVRINDIMLFGIRSQLWGSWDGNRWFKIADLGNATESDIESISRRRPTYFVDKKAGKLYRLCITKEDLIQLYYAEFLNYRGNRIDQETYVAEYRIANGTNDVDLTSVALNNAQVKIKGLSRKNYFNNSGLETGSTVDWTFGGEGNYSASSIDRYEGIYSLNVKKCASDASERAIFQSPIPVARGEILILSAWVKANVTLAKIVRLGFRNQTSGYWAYYSGSSRGVQEYNVTTSWAQVKLFFAVNSPDVNLCAEFHALKGAAYELFVDGLQLEKREVEIIRQETNVDSESIEHLQYTPSPYFADTLDTLNPSVTIADQVITHLGTMTNGSESSATGLLGTVTGAVKVDANIEGSGQAILKISGTRILHEDSIVLQGVKDNVYYGRYYGTFSPTMAYTHLIAVVNLESNITTLSYAFNELTLTIDSTMEAVSTTLIYVGDKGEPSFISGATTWSYDSETKILTAGTIHAGLQQIKLYWKEHSPPTSSIHLSGIKGNNEWFTSNVEVTLSATDDISGISRIEYSFDNITWTIYSTPFTVSTEGKAIVYYKSTDRDGNMESIKTQPVKIDKTNPSGSLSINDGAVYTDSASVMLFLTANDDSSGVCRVRYSNDGVWDTEAWEIFSRVRTWTLSLEDGTKAVHYQIKDNAGLISPTYKSAVILDTTKPTANAGVDQTVNEDTPVSLDASMSTDENGIATFSWSFKDITRETLDRVNLRYTFHTPGVYIIALNVTDPAGNSAMDTVTITVLDNTKPFADAGRDQTVLAGSIVAFDASGSSDNVGILSYEWSYGDGAEEAGVTTTHTYLSPGVYTATLTIKDAANNAASNSVSITVLTEKKQTQGFPIWILGVAVAAISTVIAVIILAKRRRQPMVDCRDHRA